MGNAEIVDEVGVCAGMNRQVHMHRRQLVNILAAEGREWDATISLLSNYDKCVVCGADAFVDMGTWALCDTHFQEVKKGIEVMG